MLTYEQIILRLALAAFLGSLVGLDRERLDSRRRIAYSHVGEHGRGDLYDRLRLWF